MKTKTRSVRLLFDHLMADTPRPFPKLREKLDAPKEAGVYVIYDRKGKVDHVGESTSIAGRLRGHMSNASSYVNKSLAGRGARLRHGYKFRCLKVVEPRERMLLQALAIGILCPRHIGARISNRDTTASSIPLQGSFRTQCGRGKWRFEAVQVNPGWRLSFRKGPCGRFGQAKT